MQPPLPHNHARYDAENRLLTAGGVTYAYDGDGKRVKKSNGKLYWYGMQSDPLAETDLAGNNPVEYVFFNGKRIARRDSAGAVSYYFADHLGSSRIVTNASGTILDDSDFYPFGGERPVLSSSGNTYKFTGKERDSESGLDNFGARYNSSAMGRFMSPDWSSAPMGVPYADFGDPQSLNLYSYARNRPLTYVDRDGHCTEPLSFVICVAIGVAAVAYGVHELHEWQKEREKAENEAFQKSLGCTASNAQCTESEIRAYDKERLNTYGEGAIKAIENTVPDATPPTTITGVVVDQAKGKAIDAMVDSAKKKDDKQGPNQPNQPGQPNPNQQPSNTPSPPPNTTTPPPPPRPQPPPLPPCALDKEKKC